MKEPAPAPAPAPAPTPAPVVESVAEAPLLMPVVEAPPVVTEFDYSVEISELQGDLKNALTIIKGLVSHVSKLEKRLNRDRKIVEKN